MVYNVYCFRSCCLVDPLCQYTGWLVPSTGRFPYRHFYCVTGVHRDGRSCDVGQVASACRTTAPIRLPSARSDGYTLRSSCRQLPSALTCLRKVTSKVLDKLVVRFQGFSRQPSREPACSAPQAPRINIAFTYFCEVVLFAKVVLISISY